MLIPLIKSKFRIPKLSPNYISRTKILKKLDKANKEGKKLITVIGNAGYGKTSLIVEYLEKNKSPNLWYTLNESDTDIIVFINHLVKGLGLVFSDFKQNSLDLLLSATNPESVLQNVMAILTEELSNLEIDNFSIVFNDFHYIRESEAVNKAVEYLIEYMPENIKVIIISRHSPHLKKLAQLKVRQEVLEISPNDLKLSIDEIKEIFEKYNIKLSESELEKIFNQTEGWIGILVLLLQTYNSDKPINEYILSLLDSNEPIFDYFANEIFELQESEIKDFLLKTSILPKIDKELCQEIGIEDFNNKIDIIKKQNLFEDNDELRYNQLFKEFLREKAKDDVSFFEVQQIYSDIARYMLKKKEYENAIENNILALDYEEAELTLLKIAQDLIYTNRIETLSKFLQKFPDEYIDISTRLNMYQGEIYRLLGEYNEAILSYQKAEKIAERENDISSLALSYVYQTIIQASKGETEESLIDKALKMLNPEDISELAFAYNTKGITYLFGEKISESLKYFESSLKYYEQLNDSIGQAKVLHNLGFAYSMLGSFEHSKSTYERAIKHAESAGKYPYIMTYNNIAIIYNYSGDFIEARNFAEKALTLSQKLGYKRDMAYAYWTLGMITSNLGEYIKSEDYFNQCLAIGMDLGDRHSQASALSGLSELARLQGKLNKSLDLIEEAIRRRDLPIDNQGLIELLMQRASIFVELNEFKLAKIDLEEYLLPKVEKLKYKYYLNHIYFHLSIVYEKENPEKSEIYTQKAFDLIKENNYYFYLVQHKHIPQSLSKKLDNKNVEVNVTKPSKIKFYCFGEFKTVIEDKVISNKDWSGFKTKMALAYLLHNPKGVTKEQLANFLYPDTDITRTAINVILTRLRKALEADDNQDSKYIIFNEGKYFFNFGTSYWLDTEEFNYLYKELSDTKDEDKKLSILKKLVELYQGDFLNEFSSELWCQIEKQVYRRKIDHVFEQLFNILYKKADYQEIITYSEKDLAIDLCNEKAFQRKIKALIAMNKNDEALKHYKIMKNVLKSQLGMEPNQESYLLYQKIRD
ncbi:MAG: tetratricopeptide repeat protein [Candidatus Sericytochromatia bacterium]